MRRRPRIFHLARMRVADRIRALGVTEEANWPIHLKRAWRILHEELGLSARQARELTVNSVSPAHTCAQAITRRAQTIAKYETRIKIHRALARLARCTRRAPARLRLLLDAGIRPVAQSGVVDSEVIEEILDMAATVFAKSPDNEAARTALGALSVTSSDGRQIIGLSSDYSGLDFDSRHKCESALSALARTTEAVTASIVFEALAAAMAADRPTGARADVSDLIVRYVAVVATLWRKAGLRPTRATRRWDPKYKSRFHRFVELVLTAMTEPSSRRHDDNIHLIAHKVWTAHTRLPPESRRLVSPRLRRADVEWLVSEDHVKKAMRMPIQKIDRDTP
jgi:hypothetical protein